MLDLFLVVSDREDPEVAPPMCGQCQAEPSVPPKGAAAATANHREQTHKIRQKFLKSYLDIGTATSSNRDGEWGSSVPDRAAAIVAMQAPWGFLPQWGGGGCCSSLW